MSKENTGEIYIDIKESIEKHLPSHVGKVLKERLQRIEVLERDNEIKLKKLKEALDEIEKLEAHIKEHESLDNRSKELTLREQNVESREKKMDVHDANLKAEEAEKRADLSKEYVNLVFKSPVYRQNITGYTASREHGGSFSKDTTEVVE